MSRQKALMEVFDSLQILYYDLHRLIAEYEKTSEWETESFQTWEHDEGPAGIVGYQNQLFICFSSPNPALVGIYSPDGKAIQKSSIFGDPFAIDIDQETSFLYLACFSEINILNLQLDVSNSWKYPVFPSDWCYYRSLKVDKDIVYVSTYEFHKIFLYRKDGKLLDTWGNERESEEQGKFNRPLGITVNHQYIYICDDFNHRVQLFTKNGKFYNEWTKTAKKSKI